jgi:glycosyltransferase involved in cell wall biosynthesis
MKILELNSLTVGSTGKIMIMTAEAARKRGHQVMTAAAKSRTNSGYKSPDHIEIGDILTRNVSLLLAYYTGFSGCFNYIATKLFLKKVDKFNPDLIHLHNLHSEYINIPLLFYYIKKHHIPVVWTLHDCWAFTGSCAHFTFAKCNQWKTSCEKCKEYRLYPSSHWDNSRKMHKLKKQWFWGVKDMTIVTPSRWLADSVKDSFLGHYNVKVINNGINTDLFRPVESNILIKYGCDGKKIVLGVAFGWNARKGLDIFVALARELPSDYQVVMVGTDDNIDKKLPQNIISIHRTKDQQELCELYSSASVFVNPTLEDTYPTTNLEAISCGTPVVTFKTGGSPEAVTPETGEVVECGDIEGLVIAVKKIAQLDLSKQCRQRAVAYMDSNMVYTNYVDLFEAHM